MQLSPYGLLLLIQPLHSSEQHIKANLEFSSNFGYEAAHGCPQPKNVKFKVGFGTVK